MTRPTTDTPRRIQRKREKFQPHCDDCDKIAPIEIDDALKAGWRLWLGRGECRYLCPPCTASRNEAWKEKHW